MEDLGGSQERDEGREVAFEMERAGEAAEGHLGALAVAVAVPVAPDEVGRGDADGGGEVQERTEGPVDGGARDVEVGDLQGAADHGEGEGAEAETGQALALGLEPRRGEEAQDGLGLAEVAGAAWGGA